MRNFQDDLEKFIKDAGEELIRRAPDIAHESDLLQNMTINISFSCEYGCVPTIDVTKTYVCKTTCSRLSDAFKEKISSSKIDKNN